MAHLVVRTLLADCALGYPLNRDLVRDLSFRFYCFSRKSPFFGWSIEGEIVKVLNAKKPVTPYQIQAYYQIHDARSFLRLSKSIALDRFVLRKADDTYCVVPFDPECMALTLVKPNVKTSAT